MYKFKKAIIFLFFIFAITIQYSFSLKKEKWSKWQKSECYGDLLYRTKKLANDRWKIQFSNQYDKKVFFGVYVIGGQGHDKQSIDAFETITRNQYYSDSDTVNIKIEGLFFDGNPIVTPPCESVASGL